jgi:hypothetical protein
MQTHQAFHGEMFVEVVPVNAITIADNLIATQFGLRGISEAREVFEGHSDFTAIYELYAEHEIVEGHVSCRSVEVNRGAAEIIMPSLQK